MKKIYFSFFALIGSLTMVSQTVPTCSLDAAFIASNKVGVWPDSATNFMVGTVGVPYVQNLTVKVPKDTVQNPVRICFTRFEVSTPTGVTNYDMPPGLMLGSSTAAVNNGTVNGAPSMKFPGNANNCASIYGTPTTAGTYTLQMQISAFGNPGLISSTCPASPNVSSGSNITTQTLRYYIIRINPAPVGLNEIAKEKFGVMQNEPNPVSGSTKIRYYVEDQDAATLTVYNALGTIVHQETVKTSVGENTFELNAGGLASGMYIYTVKYKNNVDAKRLMVNHHTN
ncbi:MAG: T9SS type A sorting domain-containing protein [Bacteroidia bacterium]|nr:T9SS type A sorting domain-containing protein [Bacteroidia bacterium]